RRAAENRVLRLLGRGVLRLRRPGRGRDVRLVPDLRRPHGGRDTLPPGLSRRGGVRIGLGGHVTGGRGRGDVVDGHLRGVAGALRLSARRGLGPLLLSGHGGRRGGDGRRVPAGGGGCPRVGLEELVPRLVDGGGVLGEALVHLVDEP